MTTIEIILERNECRNRTRLTTEAKEIHYDFGISFVREKVFRFGVNKNPAMQRLSSSNVAQPSSHVLLNRFLLVSCICYKQSIFQLCMQVIMKCPSIIRPDYQWDKYLLVKKNRNFCIIRDSNFLIFVYIRRKFLLRFSDGNLSHY